MSLIVFAIVATFAFVALALRPRRYGRLTSANGIPMIVEDDAEDVIVLDRPRRAITEPVRRLARGSVPPPSIRPVASLVIAVTTSGEFGGELRSRALTPVDEGWTFVDDDRQN